MTLTPDVNKTQQDVQQTMQAETPITIYSAAMRYQVGPLLKQPLPDWFAPIKSTLDTAVGHARTWQDSLCGTISATVPQAIIDYNTTFQDQTDQLLNVMTEIQMRGGSATPQQQQQASQLLSGLLTGLGAQQSTLAGLNTQLVALMDDLQGDHTNLVAAEATITSEITTGGELIQSLTADLGDDFLDTQVSGPCDVVSVQIKELIQLTIKLQAGSYTELLPYVIARAVLDKLTGDSKAATQALSAVLTSWQLLQDILQDVIRDVQKATGDQVLLLLKQLDIQTAQAAWAQLEEFASQLQGQ